MTYGEKRKSILQALRSKLADERREYAQMKGRLYAYFPNEWEVVSAAYQSIALYLKNEVVRCKHDMAQYMLGVDVPETYGEEPVIDELHQLIRRLPKVLERAGEAKEKYDREQTDAIKSVDLRSIYESDQAIVDQTLEDLKKLTKKMEGISYGEAK